MPWQIQDENDWIDDRQAHVTDVLFRHNDQELVIPWLAVASTSVGHAQRVNIRPHYKGDYATVPGAPEPDNGMFECDLWHNDAGERFLFGSWHSVPYSMVRQFSILLVRRHGSSASTH